MVVDLRVRAEGCWILIDMDVEGELARDSEEANVG
jgi:hypothetical protein